MTREIEADLYRYDGLKGIKGFFKGLLIPGFRYTYLLRKAAKSRRNSPKWLFFSLLKKRYEFKYGFQIPSDTEIGEGLYIGHFGTIGINSKSKIGKNCNIAHGVTIGQVSTGRLKGYPTIGDKVWIGTGAVIVGNITIGSNVFICPNAFVTLDVPDHSLVIGNPCKIVPRKNPCEGNIIFTLE